MTGRLGALRRVRGGMGLSLGLACLGACAGGDAGPPSPWFEEEAAARGLEFVHSAYTEQRFQFPEIMGGGVGLLDGDGDGDLDVLFVDSGDLHAAEDRRGQPRYFVNDGRGRFEEATERAGFTPGPYGMGVACADYDHDGDVDVFTTGVGATRLWRNDGGRFSDVTTPAGAGVPGWSTSAGFVDLDGDGWLDLFVVRYVDWNPDREGECRAADDARDYCTPLDYGGPTSAVLLANRRDGTFRDASATLGLSTARANGLGLAFGNLAAGPTSIVASDLLPNQAWSMRGERLAEVARELDVAVNPVGFAGSGMGIHAADFDDDGDLDVLVTHLRRQGHSLFVQRADGRFRDEAARFGLLRPSLPFTGFGAGFADFDGDGDLDLFVANGRVARDPPFPRADAPYAEENQVFEQRADGRFAELAPRGGVAVPIVESSRGAAFGDLDGDGGVDVVVADWRARAKFLRNRIHADRRWLGLRVLDEHGRDAVGARVELVVDGRSRFREVNPVYGYLSSNDPRVQFGLGARGRAERLRVRWADGSTQEFPVPPLGAYHTLRR